MKDTIEGRYVFAHVVEVRFRTDVEEIRTLYGVKKPDTGWKEADVHGHVHAWIDGELPSLTWVKTGTEWVGDSYDGCEVDIGQYQCNICGSVVEPKQVTSYEPEYVKGPPSYSLIIHPQMQSSEWRIPDDDVAPLLEMLKRIFDPSG